jgi:Kef-type K+ transport system membrane component KefB
MMPLLTTLLVLLITSRILGELAVRVKQPVIIGEILAGILLGPALLGIIEPTTSLMAISELAVFLIIMEAGLEMDFSEIADVLRGRGIWVAIVGFVVPLVSGLGLGKALHLDLMRTIFLGLCLAITALPVAIRIIESAGLQKTTVARYSIGSAIFSDIAALLVLGIILRIPNKVDFSEIVASIAFTGSKLLVLVVVLLTINYVLQFVMSPGHRGYQLKQRFLAVVGSEALFGIAALFVLVFSTISEQLGFHFVIGSFFGALLLDHKLLGQARFMRLQRTVSSVSTGFLSPVFFASLGLQINFSALKSLELLGSIVLVAIVSKFVSGFVVSRWLGLSRSEAWQVGSIMNGRGMMGIVIASIAKDYNFIGENMFAALVLMSVITTTLTPFMLMLSGLKMQAKTGPDATSSDH